MPTHFSRTLRALDADKFSPGRLRLLLVMLLLSAWALWFVLARVTVYVTADTARLEVNRAAHPLEAIVGGRVVVSRLVVGRAVAAGEVLVELDGSEVRLALEREHSHLEGLKTEVTALRELFTAEVAVMDRESEAAGAALEVARAHCRQANGVADFAEQEKLRTERLRADDTVSELEMMRVRTEADRLRASADALQLEVTRLEREREHRRSESQTRLRQVERDTAAMQGAIATSTASAELIAQQLERFRICAPVAGVIGEVADLNPGRVVVSGEKLGAVIPDGELGIVGQFAPGSAIGQLKPGQRAQMRLDAFPWIQHGMLAATVRTVASEVQNGRVRVELDIAGDLPSHVRLEHGLTGSVAVAVDHISPALLVTRVTGEWFRDTPRPGER